MLLCSMLVLCMKIYLVSSVAILDMSLVALGKPLDVLGNIITVSLCCIMLYCLLFAMYMCVVDAMVAQKYHEVSFCSSCEGYDHVWSLKKHCTYSSPKCWI